MNTELPRPRWDDETGIYRDCTGCHGEGIEGKGCPNCLTQRDADFQRHCEQNPPLVFKTDDEGDMEMFKVIFGDIARRPVTDTLLLMQKFREFKEGWEKPIIGSIPAKSFYEQTGRTFKDYMHDSFEAWKKTLRKEAESAAEAEREQKRQEEMGRRPQRHYQCEVCKKETTVPEPESWERIPFPKCCARVMKRIK